MKSSLYHPFGASAERPRGGPPKPRSVACASLSAACSLTTFSLSQQPPASPWLREDADGDLILMMTDDRYARVSERRLRREVRAFDSLLPEDLGRLPVNDLDGRPIFPVDRPSDAIELLLTCALDATAATRETYSLDQAKTCDAACCVACRRLAELTALAPLADCSISPPLTPTTRLVPSPLASRNSSSTPRIRPLPSSPLLPTTVSSARHAPL